MKIAVTGANGQLGTDILQAFQGLDVVGLTHEDIEITDREYTRDVLLAIKPSVIIHTAAFVRVDECEQNPELAFRVNAVGTKNVAEVARELDALLVYISTDYVFDGEKGGPYTEEDVPNPINTYGISKLAGEYYARQVKQYYIVRISSLFGKAGSRGKGGNFVDKIRAKYLAGQSIKVVDSISMSPTYALDAARCLRLMVEQIVPWGFYHLANKGVCSWYEFATAIVSQLDDKKTNRISRQEFTAQMAKRPSYSPLATSKLRLQIGDIPTWQDALTRYLW